MGVRTPAQLQLMLRTLLPVFERHGRTLVFRSWSVGLGPLGDLHHDPETYLNALGSIDSPALIVSTKFVAGDYFGFLPLNPTLLVGDHRRIIEFQARREYEGFGALPNYLGHAHRKSLHQVSEANPNLGGVVGVVALVLGLLVGVSRCYLGVHYPFDVLAGWSLAVATVGGVLLMGIW